MLTQPEFNFLKSLYSYSASASLLGATHVTIENIANKARLGADEAKEIANRLRARGCIIANRYGDGEPIVHSKALVALTEEGKFAFEEQAGISEPCPVGSTQEEWDLVNCLVRKKVERELRDISDLRLKHPGPVISAVFRDWEERGWVHLTWDASTGEKLLFLVTFKIPPSYCKSKLKAGSARTGVQNTLQVDGNLLGHVHFGKGDVSGNVSTFTLSSHNEVINEVRKLILQLATEGSPASKAAMEALETACNQDSPAQATNAIEKALAAKPSIRERLKVILNSVASDVASSAIVEALKMTLFSS